jgi:NADH-quinone oxidoreductase subunit G
MPLTAQVTRAPDGWLAALIEILVAVARAKKAPVPHQYGSVAPSAEATAVADAFMAGEKSVIWLGNAAVQHPAYGQIARIAQAITLLTGGRLGVIGEAANSVGGHLVGALPAAGGNGLNAQAMLAQPRQAYLLMGVEPSLDFADPPAARAALRQAKTVVALSAYRTEELLELSDCLLPITPFAETGGSYINCEGRLQAFNGVARPQGQARPGWKVLRVIGNAMEVAGFDFETVEAVRDRALHEFPSQASPDGRHFEARLSNRAGGDALPPATYASPALQRIADVPIYFADPLVRRARSLQLTRDARPPAAVFSAATLASLGIAEGDRVRLTQGDGQATLVARRDDRIAPGVVLVSAAHPSTAGLSRMFGPISASKVEPLDEPGAGQAAMPEQVS